MPLFDERHLSTSSERLWTLIAQRAEPGADTAAIDERIWDLFGARRAIMFTDLSGFSRGSEAFGITHFLQVIHRQRQLLYPIVSDRGGLLVKAEGDSMLILFRRPEVAIDTAVAMQKACALANQRLVAEEQVLLCIGVGYGDVLRIGDEDVWGREVNAASKLGEDTAKAGEILVTEAAAEAAAEHGTYRFAAIDAEVAGTRRHQRLDYGAPPVP
jgi:adenylate cyclase